MEIHKIKSDKIKKLLQQQLIKSLPIILFSTVIGILVFVYNNSNQSFNLLPIVLIITAGAIGLGLYIYLKKQKEILESYQISISDSLIIREQINTPTVQIARADINAIIKESDGRLIIKGRTSQAIIYISSFIDNYEALEKTLNNFHPISVHLKKSLIDQMKYPSIIIGPVLLFIVYTAKDKITVTVSGVIVTVLMIGAFFKIQKDQNINKRTKLASYMFILVIFSILSTLITKLLE